MALFSASRSVDIDLRFDALRAFVHATLLFSQ
jgi:hypothetical protein